MWSFASSAFGGKLSSKSASIKSSISNTDCSDDDISSCTSKEEGLECPICWESFNIVENIPYVLWCGHTLCKNCVLGLQRAVVKLPTIPVRLPLFVSCPWCNLLSFRLVYKGNLTIPRKNYFLLWMVESKNNERSNSLHSVRSEHHSLWPTNGSIPGSNTYQHHNSRGAPIIHAADSNSNQRHAGRAGDFSNRERIHASLHKFLASFVQLIAKLPLVIIFLLIVLYAIPASAAILALYILITVLFALPSFLVLYFAYPGLDWLLKEIFT